MSAPTKPLVTPAAVIGLVAITVIAYAIHTTSWIVHEIQGGVWPRPLELTYVVTLIVWISALGLTHVARRRLRRVSPSVVVGDERTGTLFLQAHQLALVVVVLAQIPFFFIDVPARVLAQLTVTTGVVALFASYAWLDR